MVQPRVERRLRSVGRELERMRAELAVLEEQLAPMSDDAQDARLRALVSETALADREHREVQRHADAMRRQRDRVQAIIAELLERQDELLDQIGGAGT